MSRTSPFPFSPCPAPVPVPHLFISLLSNVNPINQVTGSTDSDRTSTSTSARAQRLQENISLLSQQMRDQEREWERRRLARQERREELERTLRQDEREAEQRRRRREQMTRSSVAIPITYPALPRTKSLEIVPA